MPRQIAKLDRCLTPQSGAQMETSLNAVTVEVVNRLYKTGLYGNTPAAVVLTALNLGLRQMLLELGQLDCKTPLPVLQAAAQMQPAAGD